MLIKQNIARAFNYQTLTDAKHAVKMCGRAISESGLSEPFGPIVFTFTGDGNVSRGAQEVFECLPHKFITPEQLPDLMQSFDPKLVYGVVVTPMDYAIPTSPDASTLEHFYQYGASKFRSEFHETILPYTSVLVNGIYWEKKYPRLVTSAQLTELMLTKISRLLGIADISVDIEGSLEFVKRSSTIDTPFFLLDPHNFTETHITDSQPGDGKIMMMTVDNLPAELAHESSNHFSEALSPLIKDMINGDSTPAFDRAIITQNGHLRQKHQHLQANLDSISITASKSKTILLLGSGRVAKPLVDYFSKPSKSHIRTVIASNSLTESQDIASQSTNTLAVDIDVAQDTDGLRKLIQKADVVVSFVPATLHLGAAKLCVEQGVDMVTASYESPEMYALNDSAKKQNVIILNELGLDPGIDHLLAMKFFDQAHARGDKIKSFVSWCGGLPAPEFSDLPLGYKFSWSPRGVLLATMNPAKFLRDGKVIEYRPGEILDFAEPVNIFKGFNFEGLANRNSTQFVDIYGLDPQHLHTMFRGTLRYNGFAKLMSVIRDLGLFDSQSKFTASTWADAIDSSLKCTPKDRHEAMIQKFGPQITHDLERLGLCSSKPVDCSMSQLDALCHQLQSELQYKPGESDMICLHHTFVTESAKGHLQTHTSSLVDYGDAKYSAMAKTVALPTAIGVDLILKGQLKGTHGVIRPLSRSIYEPILDGLARQGLKFAAETR